MSKYFINIAVVHGSKITRISVSNRFIANDQITQNTLLAIATHCCNLSYLDIGYVFDKLTIDKSLLDLGKNLKNLRYLNVSGFNLNNYRNYELAMGEVLKSNKNLEHLNLLSLMGTITSRSKVIKHIIKHCNHLGFLNLRGHEVDNHDIIQLAKTNTELRQLFLDYDPTMPRLFTCAQELTTHCNYISHLYIYDFKVTDEQLDCLIVQYAKLLKLLAFRNNEELTDLSVYSIVDHCPQLTWLSLCKCTHITDSGALQILNHCSKLQALDVTETKITDTTIKNILCKRHVMTELKFINVYNCKIKRDTYRELFRTFYTSYEQIKLVNNDILCGIEPRWNLLPPLETNSFLIPNYFL